MKVSEYVAEFLYKHGITDVFTLSGGGAIHLDNAVLNHPNLREICIKNEATGPMMAEAYARVKNNFGVVLVTTGPGGANAVTGVVECFVDSSPVMIISGQAPVCQTTRNANIQGLRSFGVQELNIIEVVKSITKYAVMIIDKKKIRYELEKSLELAKSGRPGPVWIDIPIDIQSADIDVDTLFGYDKKGDVLSICEKSTKIAEDLSKSKRPLILCGQGIKNPSAIKELKELAELYSCPIIFSRLGLDSLPYSYKNNMGIGGMRGSYFNKLIMKEADVILAVGTSMSVAFAGHNLSFINPEGHIYMVDIGPEEIMKVRDKLTDSVICDAKQFLNYVIDYTKQSALQLNNHEDRNLWLGKCIDYKIKFSAKSFAQAKNPIDIYYLAKKVDELTKENDIFVDDAGSIYYVASQILSFEHGTKEITSGAYASMGLAIPLSIGAAVANPNARILTMTGDGSLETNVQELKTLSYYNLNVKLFVINNGGYISMRDHGRHTSDEKNAILNLKKVAEAYDMPYYLIDDYKQFDTYLPSFINNIGPAFIEVMCDDQQKLILPE